MSDPIIAPNRFNNVTAQDKPVLRFSEYLEDVTRTLNTLTSNTDAYTVTNAATDRTFDADTVTVAELADVVATLIVDLKAAEIIP